jgi:hypothetical protein
MNQVYIVIGFKEEMTYPTIYDVFNTWDKAQSYLESNDLEMIAGIEIWKVK